MSEIKPGETDTIRSVIWAGDHIRLLDQRQLPERTEYLEFHVPDALARAITDMVVRGAPAIGIAAGYGAVLAARQAFKSSPKEWRERIEQDLTLLAQARPTAVNLKWALDRMRRKFSGITGDPEPVLLAEAIAIHEEDIAANKRMALLGAEVIQGASRVLTHCNTGSLATGGYGTALGVIRAVYTGGLLQMVYVGETRPWLQGARLTAWELLQDKIPVTLITDSAASHLLKTGAVDWIIVGADRIAANGDVANKIGTYALAVSARHHGVGFMVVAPTSTFDLATKSGADIPIENRAPDEIIRFGGNPVAPLHVTTWNPAFDITPAELIDVIVTEKGVIHQPDKVKIAALIDVSVN